MSLVAELHGMHKAMSWRQISAAARGNVALELRHAAESLHARMVAEKGEVQQLDDEEEEGEGDATPDVSPRHLMISASDLDPFQWVAALVEVSWLCFPHLYGVGKRLGGEFELSARVDREDPAARGQTIQLFVAPGPRFLAGGRDVCLERDPGSSPGRRRFEGSGSAGASDQRFE